jgi:hypothetical protein
MIKYIFIIILISVSTKISYCQHETINIDFPNLEPEFFSITGPGFNELPVAKYYLGNIPTDNAYENATDGFGLIVNAQPGDGILLLGPQLNHNGPVLIWCNIRSDSSTINASIASIQIPYNDFLNIHTVNNGYFFVRKYKRIAILHIPASDEFLPLIQIINSSNDRTSTFYIDNLEIHKLNSKFYYQNDWIYI